MKVLFFFYISILVLTISCSPETNIEKAYKLAGNNKSELQAVIQHYSKRPIDSLKLEAAKFLIGQMNYNFSTHRLNLPSDEQKSRYEKVHETSKQVITGDSIMPMKTLKLLMDSLRLTMIDIDKDYQEKTLLLDANELSKKALINHIDKRFWVWNNSLFCKGLSKKDFFETVLPYRARNEPLDMGMDYTKRYFNFFNKDSTIVTSKNANIKLNNYLKSFIYSKEKFIPYSHSGLYSILEAWGKECIDKTTHSTKILRSAGIPTFIEFTPQWSNRIANRRHFWCSIKYGNEGYKLFSPPHEVIGDSSTSEYKEHASKIYRYRGIINKETPYFLRSKKEYVPSIFNNPYIFDNTSQHFNVTSIKVPVNEHKSGINFCYLATFNAPSWMPVAYTSLNEKNVTFTNVRNNLIYTVIYYPKNSNTPIPLSEPFFVKKNGTIDFIKPNKNKKHFHLFQKYQQKEEINRYVKMVVGAKIQVANKRDFSDAITLHTITKFPKPITYSIPLNTEKKYRYARIISNKERKSLNITHVEFHTSEKIDTLTGLGVMPSILSEISSDSLNTLKLPTKLIGEVYCSIRKWMSKPMKISRLKACDGDYTTYTYSSEVSFDFGKPVDITSFRYIPRHADNWVAANQRYVLSYYDNGWQIADTVKAKYNFLDFDSVPSNTIYWLQNIESGREEQAFVYLNNKQIFINTKNFKNRTTSPFIDK